MRSAIEKTSLLILQNISAITFLLIPLFFLTSTVNYFTFNKFYLLVLLATISLFFWCLHNITNKKIILTASPTLTGLFFLFLIHLASSFFVSPTKVLSLTGLTTLFGALFFFVLATTSVKNNLNSLQRQISALLVSLAFLSFFTLLHYFGLTKYLLGSNLTQSAYFNLTGGIVPALTFSLPLLFGTLVYLYYSEKTTTKITLFALSALITAATIINISLLLPQNGINPTITLPLKASWSIALDIFKNPLTATLGTGPETYLSTFTKLRPVYLNQNPALWNIRFSESGSFFLTLITTTGLLGGLTFLYLFTKNLSLALRTLSTENHKGQKYFLISSLFGFFIVSLFTPFGLVSVVTTVLLLGTLIGYFKIQDVNFIKQLHFNIYDEKLQNTNLSLVLPISVLVVSVVISSVYWVYGIRFYQATVFLNQAKSKSNSDLLGSFLKQQQAQKLNPYDPTYHLVLSQTYQQVAYFYLTKQNPTDDDKKNALETMQRSIDAARLAAQKDPQSVLVWENLANIYQTYIGAAQGSGDLAISHLAKAITLDPTNPKLRLQMGILYYNLKDKEQAIKLINQAIELKTNWDVPYLNLYKIYIDGNDLQKAQVVLKKAVELTSTTSENYEKLQQELVSLTEKISKK